MIACAGARRTASSVSISQTRELQYAAAINEDIVSYLEETCAAGQSRESIARFMKACEPFGLKRAEVLNLVNEQPNTLVEIHLIVEECEERLSAEQVQHLLDTCVMLSAKSPAAAASASTNGGL